MAKMTPYRAIRKKCLDCTCDQAAEVRLCIINDCPLWPYRFGHKPADGVSLNPDNYSGKIARKSKGNAEALKKYRLLYD